MADSKIQSPTELHDVLAALREGENNVSSVSVVIDGDEKVKFSPKTPTVLRLLSSSSDGTQGIRDAFAAAAGDVGFSVLRYAFNYETAGVIKADATRFIFIKYLPKERLPMSRRMALNSRGDLIRSLLTKNMPIAAEFTFQGQEELQTLTDDMVAQQVAKSVMKNSNVKEPALNKANGMVIAGNFVSMRNAAGDSQNAKMMYDSPGAVTKYAAAKGADVTVDDEDTLKAVIKDIWKDTEPINFVYLSYADETFKVVSQKSSGENVSEMLSGDSGQAGYGVFRFQESYGDVGNGNNPITNVRFGFATFVSSSLSPRLKALISTHKGAIRTKLRELGAAWQVDLHFDAPETGIVELAVEKVSKTSGSKSHVTDRKAVKKEKVYERKFLGGVTAQTQSLKVSDDVAEAVKEGIRDVRDDVSDVVWTKVSLENDELRFGASGDSLSGVIDSVEDTLVQYFFIRTVLQVDGIPTTKFFLVKYVGESVPITVKGAAGNLHGAITKLFPGVHKTYTFGEVDQLKKLLGL